MQNMEEWGADRIRQLRKSAGLTQAKLAEWLGVTVKQVKYLEHNRRRPSGPARRLLEILEAQLNGRQSSAVQLLGSSVTLSPPPPAAKPQPSAQPQARPDPAFVWQ